MKRIQFLGDRSVNERRSASPLLYGGHAKSFLDKKSYLIWEPVTGILPMAHVGGGFYRVGFAFHRAGADFWAYVPTVPAKKKCLDKRIYIG